MISLELAQKLKAAGLTWSPAKNDFFTVPDGELEETVFVLTDMTIMLANIGGQLSVTFHGTAEWALDHVLISEVLWLPTESQLRTELEQRLLSQPQPAVLFYSTEDGYRCAIKLRGRQHSFDAFGAEDAYGLALLYALQHTPNAG